MNVYGLIAYSFAYALFNVAGAALIKSQIQTGKPSFNGIGDYLIFLLKAKTLLGLGLVFLAALILFKALSLYEFTRVIPLSIGINFILTAALGHFWFHESLPLMKLSGMGLILAGSILIAVTK